MGRTGCVTGYHDVHPQNFVDVGQRSYLEHDIPLQTSPWEGMGIGIGGVGLGGVGHPIRDRVLGRL